MKLDDRLQAIFSLVPEGGRLADIGTDHAYLPCALVEAGVVTSAIAGDINEGPYEAAKRTIRERGLVGRVEARLGDGLSVLAPGEAETISLSGMGGMLMRDILLAHEDVTRAARTLVLQPQSAVSELREWLYESGFYIDAERLASDDGHIYTAMRVLPGERVKPEPILLAIGPCLWRDKPALLRHYIEKMLFECRKAAVGMETSERARQSARYREVTSRMKELEEHLRW